MLVDQERLRQNKIWNREEGAWPDPTERKLSVLAEEFGEVAMALNDEDYANLMIELVQVMAVCSAWIEDEY